MTSLPNSNEQFNSLEFNNIEDTSNSILSYNRSAKINEMTKIKYIKDTSYDLFDEIFSDMEFENIEGEIVKINNYNDFYDFQINLNSYYDSHIKFFDYKNRVNVNILKEIPYKATRLRTLFEEDGAITISPNGHFVKTGKINNKSQSTLEHYNTVIGNSLILNGVYYYEIKILELGEDTDMCFGIISRNSKFIKDKKYKNYPLCEFEDCYGFNLNNKFNRKYYRERKTITVGTIISIKVNLVKNKINIYIDGNQISNNSINIRDGTLGYYPAFSLSSGKEIQVKFGGVYNLYMYFNSSNQIDAKPICQYNNLENIVSCYLKIIDNCLMKIINHKQISYNDSIKYFYPMLSFFANIAFNDEYIMKNHILKYMYKNNFNKKDIKICFDEKFNFFYLIIANIEKSKQQKSILFLLDCLCEDIKNDLYITNSNDKITNVSLMIKLYDYLLGQNIIKAILFPKEGLNEFVYEKIKTQLGLIFQTVRIFGITHENINYMNTILVCRKKVCKIINYENYLNSFSELIETLLGLKLENQNNKTNKIDELINKLKLENKKQEKNTQNSIKENQELNEFDFLEEYLFGETKNKELLLNENKQPFVIKSRKLEYNPYRKIFIDLINDNFGNKSNNTYNIIATIFLPLLNLFNIHYEKENNSNYTQKIILSYLPILWNKKNYLNHPNPKTNNLENIMISEDKIKSIQNIIDKNILSHELNKKEYNVSSYLIKMLINLSSFFGEELFDFDLYLQNCEYNKIVKRWKTRNEISKINNYIENMKKLIFLNNDYNIKIIKRSLDSLIPYFRDLLNNNFYLFLPLKFINLLRFLIKFVFYHYLIFNDKKIIRFKNLSKLIQLFVDYNFKLLYDKYTNKLFFFYALDNIKFLYNLLYSADSIIIYYRDNESDKEKDEDEDNDLSDEEDIKDFRYYIKKEQLKDFIVLLRNFFEKNSSLENMKYLTEFLLNFHPDIFSVNHYVENVWIPYILIDLKDNNFWFMTFIMKHLIKKKLIAHLLKADTILKEGLDYIDSLKKKKLKKYFRSIAESLNLISGFFGSTIVLNKYFNAYISKDILENCLEESKSQNDKKSKNKNECSIYFVFIRIAALIIKNLFNSNFDNFCKKKINKLNKHDFNVKVLIRESFNFLSDLFLVIPEKYEKMLEDKEKNNNKNKKKKNIEKKEEKKLNEDLKFFYMNIINNITKNDIMRLFPLIEDNKFIRRNIDGYKRILRKYMLFFNDIETKYNLVHKEKQSQEDSQDSNICPICLDKEKDIHVSPCGHMFCYECIKKLNDKRCPICRKDMTGVREHPEFRFNINHQHFGRGFGRFALNDVGQVVYIDLNDENNEIPIASYLERRSLRNRVIFEGN